MQHLPVNITICYVGKGLGSKARHVIIDQIRRGVMQFQEQSTLGDGKPAISLDKAEKSHLVMPAKVNDGERWIIDSDHGSHLVGDTALTAKESILIEWAGHPQYWKQHAV